MPFSTLVSVFGLEIIKDFLKTSITCLLLGPGEEHLPSPKVHPYVWRNEKRKVTDKKKSLCALLCDGANKHLCILVYFIRMFQSLTLAMVQTQVLLRLQVSFEEIHKALRDLREELSQVRDRVSTLQMVLRWGRHFHDEYCD